MKVSVRVDGLKEFDAALGELSKATARNTLRRVLMKAGQPMAETAARLAPDDPETGSPDLHTSITVSASLKNPVGKAEYRDVLQAGGSRGEALQAMRDARRAGSESFAEVYVGPDYRQFHAHFQELGTAHHGPQPYMRPAFDQEAGTALDIIKSELGGEIEKAARRAARRAVRRAARGS